MKKFFVLFLLLILLTLPVTMAFSLDFGLLFNNYFGLGNAWTGDDVNFEYKGSLVPRLSFPVGENGEVFISASMTLGYEDEVYYYPELLRTEYNMRAGSWGFRLGRVNYSDPSGYIASGLFDGLQLTHTSGIGRFKLGAWYSGFIFKKTAMISMTAYDEGLINSDLDYGDFADSYFGSRRLLAALEWEHPTIAERLSLKFSVLGQFDLNDEDEVLNSQFFILRLGLPVSRLLIEAGGSLALNQYEAGGESASGISFAGDIGLYITMPTSFYSRLAVAGYYTSGNASDDIWAFNPVSTIYFGNIVQAKRTALSVVSLEYSARANEALGLSLSASYFIRNDLVTGTVAANAEEEYFMGPEIFARVVWGPVSDLQFNFGGGAFIPALGNVWKDAEVQWKIELSAVLAIF